MRWKLWSTIKPSYLYIKYIMLEPSIITFYLNSGVIISFLKIYSIFLVNVDNTHRGAVLIIREKYFPYFPIIISIKKTYTLNWLAMFYQIFFPPWPNNSPLMVDGIKKCLCCYHTFIDSIWCGYLNPIQNNPLYFLFFCCIRISPILRHQGLWINIFTTYGSASGASCVLYSNMTLSFARDFSGFVKFLLFTNAPPLLSLKKNSSDTFILYIIMVELHGSSVSTL